LASRGDVLVTTLEAPPGYRVVRVLGVVSGSSTKARGLGGDILAGLRNLVGGEVTEYTELLEAAREEALERLKRRARELGANAVLGVRLATSAISQGVSEVVWYGTAAVVERVE